MDASLSTTIKFPIIELENATKKEYPIVPAVMASPLLQIIREVLGLEFVHNLIVKLRF